MASVNSKKNKKGMGECIRKTVTKLRALSMETKYLRCNAGEHLNDMMSLSRRRYGFGIDCA
jgi:hypothetical protein